jgi:hypothetical protein
MLDVDLTQRFAGRDGELITVDHHPYGEAVDRGYRTGDPRGPERLRTAEERGQHRTQHGGAPSTEGIPAIHQIALMVD